MATTTELSLLQLSKIFDAITRDLERLFQTNDEDKLEKKFGSITLLHESQKEISKHLGMFPIENVTWYPGQVKKIREIRISQGLPAEPTALERLEWLECSGLP
ncbi:MAG: hypothetical protein ACTS9Y_00520 [Methylophilus sp.]|uniref:hypothetical protein n=1 Tax=Methylophilus sp. TaxID=29541 RepID=UPI003F9F06E1